MTSGYLTQSSEEYYEVLFHRYQWEEALNQAKKDLRPEEQAEIERFKTPDHLMVDLKERLEQRPSDEAFRRVVFSVHPYLNVVRDLSSLFLFYMRPYAIETALIWGLVHITISVSLFINFERSSWLTKARALEGGGMYNHAFQPYKAG